MESVIQTKLKSRVVSKTYGFKISRVYKTYGDTEAAVSSGGSLDISFLNYFLFAAPCHIYDLHLVTSYFRCGVLVSGDSAGSVQFWDSQHGTLLQAHSNHKGDVNALAAASIHNRVFSAGSDGQVILYNLAGCTHKSQDLKPSTKKWDYIGCVRAHTHDIRALTVAVPITSEGSLPHSNAKGKSPKQRRKEKPVGFSYHKWAHLGVSMLISAGDDAKLP